MNDPYPTKEDIAKVLSETIKVTGQNIGIVNIHHTINRLHEMFHESKKKENVKNQLTLL